MGSGGSALRLIEVGETFEVAEGPRNETKPGPSRIRGRSQDPEKSQDGWFSQTIGVAQWQPRYRCRESTILSKAAASSSELVRKLEMHEMIEALDLPILEKSTAFVRVRCATEKDRVVGFAT